jgi:hypothetical protein
MRSRLNGYRHGKYTALLTVNEAKQLQETLIQYAADTKDHTVSDKFVQLQT